MERTGPTVPGSTTHIDVKLAAIGALSGIAAAMMMDTFSRLMQGHEGGREAAGATPGRDRTGRGGQPAQAEGSAEQDATVKVGLKLHRTLYSPRICG